MESILSAIDEILRDEMNVYGRMRELEELKTAAIMDRDGRLIESISKEQEDLIIRIDLLEEKRISVTKRATGSANTTLRELASGSNHVILRTGSELKNMIRKLQDLQHTNGQLARDNLQYYEAIVNGLRESSSIRSGYGRDGREKSRVARPAIFSQHA